MLNRLLPLLLLAVGCAVEAGPDPLPPSAEPAPLQAEPASAEVPAPIGHELADDAVAYAAAHWQRSAGWMVHVAGVHVLPSDHPRVVAARANGGGELLSAFADLGTREIIFVAEKLGDLRPLWRAVALHEMGHLYGLDHVAEEGATMCATVKLPLPDCLSAADVAEFERVNGAPAAATCD